MGDHEWGYTGENGEFTSFLNARELTAPYAVDRFVYTAARDRMNVNSVCVFFTKSLRLRRRLKKNKHVDDDEVSLRKYVIYMTTI